MLQHMLEVGLVDGFSVLKFWFFHPSSSQCPISEDGIVKGQKTNICTCSRTITFLVTHVSVTNLQNPDPPVYLWPLNYSHEFSLLLGLDSVLKVLDHLLQRFDFWPRLACLAAGVWIFAKPCVFVWLPLPLAAILDCLQHGLVVVRASLGLSQSKSQPSSHPRQSWVCLRTWFDVGDKQEKDKQRIPDHLHDCEPDSKSRRIYIFGQKGHSFEKILEMFLISYLLPTFLVVYML